MGRRPAAAAALSLQSVRQEGCVGLGQYCSDCSFYMQRFQPKA